MYACAGAAYVSIKRRVMAGIIHVPVSASPRRRMRGIQYLNNSIVVTMARIAFGYIDRRGCKMQRRADAGCRGRPRRDNASTTGMMK